MSGESKHTIAPNDLSDMIKPVAGRDSEKFVEILYKRYLRLTSILDADVEELEKMVGKKVAVQIKLLARITSRRLTERFEFGKVHSESEIADYLKALFMGLSVEHLYLISFSKDGKVLAFDRIGVGSVNSAAIIPRSVIETAIKRGAKSVALAHNHPGGSSKPSKEDAELTSNLASVLEKAGIELIGHYVVSGDECTCIAVSSDM